MKTLPSRISQVFNNTVDLIRGYHAFISFAHKDGEKFPEAIADDLTSRHFRVFIDKRVYLPGDRLGKETKRRVRMSRCLVLVGGPHSYHSKWVEEEVLECLRSKRRLLVLDINRSLAGLPDDHSLKVVVDDTIHIAVEMKSKEEKPSPDLIKRLEDSLEPGRLRQEKLERRVAFWTIAIPVILLLVLITQTLLGTVNTSRNAERFVTQGEEAMANRQFDVSVQRLNEALAIVRAHVDVFSQRNRVERLLGRAQALRQLETFVTEASVAEHHILGSLFTLKGYESTPDSEPIIRAAERAGDLATGIVTARRALERYGLPANVGALGVSQLETNEMKQLRSRSAEVLFLLALAIEREGQGAGSDRKRSAREEACRLLDISEELGNKTKSLYKHRAKFLGLLGRPADAAADRLRAEKVTLATFMDHHLRAVELVRDEKDAAQAATEYQLALAIRPDDYWTLYRLAKCLESLRRLTDAEAMFRNLLVLRPGDPTTHNALGTLLDDQGNHEEAIAEFEAALRAQPDYIMTYANMMKAQGNLKKVEAAQDTFNRLMARQIDQREKARAWDFLGVAYERAGQDEVALKKYTTAVELNPENPGILRNRSLCLSRLRRHDEAVKDINSAIMLKPGDGELRHVKGNIFAYWGRDRAAIQGQSEAIDKINAAIEAYCEAIELDYKPARYNRAVLLRQLGKFQSAVSDLDALLLSAPNDAYSLFERAMNRLHMKDYRTAIDDLDRVLILDTPRALELRREAYLARGKAWGDLGTRDDLIRSEADLNRVIDLAANDPDGYRSRGLTRMRLGENEPPRKVDVDEQRRSWIGQIEDYQKYLQLRPDSDDVPSILNDLNLAYLQLGKHNEAINVLTKAIERKPDPIYYANRGNIHLMQSDLEDAAADFDSAIKLDPTHVRAWALRGQARLRQGRFDDAASDFDQALKLSPRIHETLILRSLGSLGGKRVEAAKRDLEQVARELADHVRGKFARGVLGYLDRQFVHAIVDLSAGIEDPVLRPFGLPYRARVFLALGTEGVMSAVADAEELLRIRPNDGYAFLEAARIYALTATPERGERALALVSQAIKQRPELRERLATDTELKSLAPDPRFRKLLEQP